MKRVIPFFVFLILIMQLLGCGNKQKINIDIKNTFGTSQAASLNNEGVNIILYYPDDKVNYLLPETRVVKVDKFIEKTIAEEIIKGPFTPGHSSIIPINIKVLSVSRDKSTLILNLSSDFKQTLTGVKKHDDIVIYSFVNSLTELPGVRNVKFEINGKTIQNVNGIRLDAPFPRKRKLLSRNMEMKPDMVLKKEMNFEKDGKWLDAFLLMSDDETNPYRKYYDAYVHEMEDMKEQGFLNVDFKVDGYNLEASGKKARVKVIFYSKNSSGEESIINTAYFNCVNIDGAWMVDWSTKQ